MELKSPRSFSPAPCAAANMFFVNSPAWEILVEEEEVVVEVEGLVVWVSEEMY